MGARAKSLWRCCAGRLKKAKIPVWRDPHATFRGLAVLVMIRLGQGARALSAGPGLHFYVADRLGFSLDKPPAP